MITLADLNDAYQAWQQTEVAAEDLHNHPNTTSKMIADALNNASAAFERYTQLLDTYFTTRSEHNASGQRF